MWPHAKEGGREGYRERVTKERGPSNIGRVGLTLKFDELL